MEAGFLRPWRRGFRASLFPLGCAFGVGGVFYLTFGSGFEVSGYAGVWPTEGVKWGTGGPLDVVIPESGVLVGGVMCVRSGELGQRFVPGETGSEGVVVERADTGSL